MRLSNKHAVGGSAPSVYGLSTKGRRLIESGEPSAVRTPRLAEEQRKAKNPLFMTHTLAANDFLISAELVCRNHPALTLVDMLSEGDVKRNPVAVRVGGRQRFVAVDGWLNIHIRREEQACVCLELDRGTEAVDTWKEKVRALLAFANGPYQKTFGTEALTIAVVATPGEKRRNELWRWTEQEVYRLRETQEADVFRFFAGHPSACAPDELFLAPVWHRPFDETPLPLLELAGEQ